LNLKKTYYLLWCGAIVNARKRERLIGCYHELCNTETADLVSHKTALITYKALKTGQPVVYLCDLLHYYQPACTVRSSSQLLLSTLSAGDRDQLSIQSIQYHGMTSCLELTVSGYTKNSATITTFKSHLKTELFTAA